MDCLSCGHLLKRSEHSKAYGLTSFRCSQCNSLFSDKDLDNQFVKSNFSYDFYGEFFESLNKNNKAKIPIGSGKSFFLEELAKKNDFLFITQPFLCQQYKKIKNVIPFHKFINKADELLKTNQKIIVDDLSPPQYFFLKKITKDSKKLYFINPHE